MKTLRLLATLLLVALCTGLSSCSEKIDELYPDEAYTGGDSYSTYGINTKEIECRGSYQSSEDRNHFSGLKKNHLWISTYDRNTKEKLFEWTDTRTFDRNRRVHVGYGEYKDVTLSSITTYGTCYKNNNLVAVLNYSFDGYSESKILFNSSNNTKEISTGFSGRQVVDWYKESVVVGNCCYNNLGDTLFVAPKGIAGIPVSYEEGIGTSYSLNDFKSIHFGRWNFKKVETIWTNEVKLPFEVTYNAKTSCTLLDKSTNIWKYRFDIIYYDGTKKDYAFVINIETGVLIGNEQPITLANLKGTWDMVKCYGWEYNGKGVKEDWTEDVKGEYIFFEDVDGNGGYNDGDKTYYFASSINGNKLVLRNSDWLEGKEVTITKLTNTELHITATDKVSEENYEMKRR